MGGHCPVGFWLVKDMLASVSRSRDWENTLKASVLGSGYSIALLQCNGGAVILLERRSFLVGHRQPKLCRFAFMSIGIRKFLTSWWS